MNKLVENLLNISRIESGRLEFSFEDLDFRELVEEAVEELKIVAAENELEINLKQPKSKINGKDKFAVFSVKDNGRGVSKDDQCRLFQKFTRGNGVSTMHTEGTGLGLFVCRKMVEAHKGYVWIESEGEGKGSKFAFAVGAAV